MVSTLIWILIKAVSKKLLLNLLPSIAQASLLGNNMFTSKQNNTTAHPRQKIYLCILSHQKYSSLLFILNILKTGCNYCMYCMCNHCKTYFAFALMVMVWEQKWLNTSIVHRIQVCRRAPGILSFHLTGLITHSQGSPPGFHSELRVDSKNQ